MSERGSESHAMSRDDYTRANRAAWDEVVPVHQEQRRRRYDLEAAVAADDFCALEPFEIATLDALGLDGRSVVHLCCNNGIELISLLKRGVGRGVGIDISEAAIVEARRLAARSGVEAEFLCRDLYQLETGTDDDADGGLEGAFDLAYVSAGGLFWLPDLDAAFATIARLLRPGGDFFLCDVHPFVHMLTHDINREYSGDMPPRIRNGYFRAEPLVSRHGMDYIGQTRYEARPNYKFLHTLSAIVSALGRSGIATLALDERPEDLTRIFPPLIVEGGLPLTFTLTGRKL
ncbi:MAG: class I SAM-dependent methyltransferase [Acidobacteriota bacterium]